MSDTTVRQPARFLPTSGRLKLFQNQTRFNQGGFGFGNTEKPLTNRRKTGTIAALLKR
ncbi:hypothetical protein ACFPVS_00915 [Neisseria weixii]|uniref:hypothetical protein n=1 Tax=Neisseria weixii TaxID=1853276 RepID=UPI0012FD4CE2|nr:hypothetical protein [Neisseria weixii]